MFQYRSPSTVRRERGRVSMRRRMTTGLTTGSCYHCSSRLHAPPFSSDCLVFSRKVAESYLLPLPSSRLHPPAPFFFMSSLQCLLLFDVLLFIFVCYRYHSLQPVIRARNPSPYGWCLCPRRCLSVCRCLVVLVSKSSLRSFSLASLSSFSCLCFCILLCPISSVVCT